MIYRSMPGGICPPGIFYFHQQYLWTEVMQIGERTARTGPHPAGPHSFSWSYIGFHLFRGGGFGTFCDRLPGTFPVSCVLDKGGALM